MPYEQGGENFFYAKMRSFIQTYYPCFSEFLDPGYMDEVNTGDLRALTSRYWELLFIKLLKENHPDLNINRFEVGKNKGGPDFVIVLSDGRRILIECVCPQNAGDPAGKAPDTFSRGGNIASEIADSNKKICIRIANSLSNKKKDYEKWREIDPLTGQSLITKSDIVIIAMGLYGLPREAIWHFMHQSECYYFMSQIPLLQTFFPFGAIQADLFYPAHANPEPRTARGPYVQREDFYKKPSKKPEDIFINRCLFVESTLTDSKSNSKDDYTFLSGVLFSSYFFDTDQVPHLAKDSDFSLVHNPFAKNPMPSNFLKIFHGEFSYCPKTDRLNAHYYEEKEAV